MPPFAHAAITDAASVCGCGMLAVALHPKSPERSFKALLSHRIQIMLSLHASQTSKSRDRTVVHFSDFADAASSRRCGRSVVAMQRVSPKQSLTGANLTQTHTALSLLAAQTIETRDKGPIRCSYSNGRLRVNLNSNSKAPDALHQALLSQVTSILLDSEDVEIVDVCHHTVVPPA